MSLFGGSAIQSFQSMSSGVSVSGCSAVAVAMRSLLLVGLLARHSCSVVAHSSSWARYAVCRYAE